jgi:molecular chaperone GrpE
VESQAAAAAEASDASGTEAGAADPAARVASLEAELAELNDRYLRKMADFENLRKRVAKEKEEIRLYANTELLLDLIGLLDDFDRAIGSSESSQDWKSLHDGVSMIQRAFLGRLEGRYGLKRFEGAGEAFDPNRHEALMAEERDDVDKPVVAEVLLPGYTLHERVIRASKVKVAKPAQTAGGEAETPPSSGE